MPVRARREIVDDLDRLLEVLPDSIRTALADEPGLDQLIEIVLDLGRVPEARFPKRYVDLSDRPVTREQLDFVLQRVGQFGRDNRAGIERTLHRISCIRNRQGDIVGITCRVGRAVFGTIEMIRDIFEDSHKSVLLLGRPGVGKTTMLREIARVMADKYRRRVVVVDTSNEIAGDGDVPHPAIGRARRMQVPLHIPQADVMIEAVENHMPEVIVVDEIGTEAEAEAARTIAERGVQLIATAHGNTLSNLVMNPTLADLVGGIQSVTLGDEEARKRGTQKSVLERKAPPTFDIVIEIQEKDRVAIHHDVAKTVDLLLRGVEPQPEIRCVDERGEPEIVQRSNLQELYAKNAHLYGDGRSSAGGGAPELDGPVKIYPFAVSRNRLEAAIRGSQAALAVTHRLEEADIVLTLKGKQRKLPKKVRQAEERGIPVHVVRSNTQAQIQGFVDAVESHGPQILWTTANGKGR